MTKRRLTKRQMTRQKKLQTKRLERVTKPAEATPSELNPSLGNEQSGLLIAHYGGALIVESQTGQLFRCGLRQNLGTLVTGDQIIWQQIDELTGIVVACLPRRSLITRPDKRASKPIVANVDQMVIVTALEPLPQTTTLDRYLVLAELLQLRPLLVLNKCDLLFKSQHDFLLAQLDIYLMLNYPLIKISNKTGMGFAELQSALQHHTSILVGQSGVGKSSLLTHLIPTAQVQIGELSKSHRLGRHTTTATRLYHLPAGGDLIDSPGIHQFNLHHFSAKTVIEGFKEFAPYLGLCRFRNCEHNDEPGCALKIAVQQGKIAAFRLKNYHTIISTIE